MTWFNVSNLDEDYRRGGSSIQFFEDSRFYISFGGSGRYNESYRKYTGHIKISNVKIEFEIWSDDENELFKSIHKHHVAFKSSNEIAEMNAIYDIIFLFVIDKSKPQLLNIIKSVADEAYSRGKQDKLDEIKEVLGLENF